MRTLRKLRDRLRAFWCPDRVHDDIADEFRFHVEMRTRENERSGMSSADARRDAQQRFGSVARMHDIAYDVRGGGWLEALWQDIRYGGRMMAAQKMFSATVILAVGVGVGANATIFTLVDRLLLRALPVERPAELEQLTLPNDWSSFSAPFFRELRRRNDVFSSVLARTLEPGTIGASGDARRGIIELVSGNYFSVLGTHAAQGRLLNDEDDRASLAAPAAVVSDRYWRSRLSSNPAAIGTMIQIDSHPFTVVGVAESGFFGLEVGTEPDVWVSLAMQPQLYDPGTTLANDADANWLDVIGRRAPGVTHARAELGATAVLQAFQKESARPVPKDWPQTIQLIGARRGLSRLRRQYEASLRLLMSVVAIVMLIACTSIASLMMTRSTARQREIAVRLTLGGTRARLVRQLLTEASLLSLCGGAIGVIMAKYGLGALVHVLPAARVPSSVDANLDARSLAFSLAVSTLTALLVSAGPALRSTRPDLAGAIRSGGDSTNGRIQRVSGRKVLVATQVALSLVLVIGASLFTRSLAHLAAIPLGFQTENVVIASIDPSLSGYTTVRVTQFYHELESRLGRIPDVRAAGFSEFPLLGGEYTMRTVTGPGASQPSDAQSTLLATNTVGGDFFGAAGIPLRRGRSFDARDSLHAPRVVVLNESAARHYFGDQNAVGRSVVVGVGPAQVVGVVSDTKYSSVREANPRIMYLPADQDPGILGGGERTIYVHTAGDATRFAGELESVVRSLDKTIPLYNVKTLATQKAESLVRERLVTALSTLSGAIALALAAIALYGLISFGAVSRTREIGIRVSLGADRLRVIWLIVRSAARMVVVGCGAGLALGVVLSRFVQSQVYGIGPIDAATMAIAVAILLSTTVGAALIPALRAARVDPTVVLRCE